MYSLVLTPYGGAILGPIAKLLGYIMNGIFIFLDNIGIPSIGLAIILFTIVMYLLMTPLTYKQQKFSKLSQKMNPELQAIQAKYKGKKDQDSMTRMNEETRAVYDKYGVSPSGSCVQLAITMPVMLALYRVIYAMPAYVTKIGDTFRVLAEKVVASDNGAFLINSGIEDVDRVVKQYGKSLTDGSNVTNGVIDILNKISSSDLQTISNHYDLNNLTYNGQLIISELNSNGKIVNRGLIDQFNNFLGMNIGDSPSQLISSAWHNASGIQWGLIIAALLIPFLAAATQWINTKLMPQPTNNNNNNAQADTMNATMKSMNTMMPIMSAVFCFTFPSGIGLYWIAGAVIRSVQQVVINKKIDKENIDEIIEKNAEKAKEKAKKRVENAEKLNKYGTMSTKANSSTSTMTKKEKEEAYNKAMEARKNGGFAAGSLAAKANMVSDYNARKNKGDNN